jgi:hypothetical protein
MADLRALMSSEELNILQTQLRQMPLADRVNAMEGMIREQKKLRSEPVPRPRTTGGETSMRSRPMNPTAMAITGGNTQSVFVASLA